MKRKFEVTILFYRGPAYTGYALTENGADAQSLVLYDAGCNGFKEKHRKVIVAEVQ